jgi:arylsulfate sulfotransferase
MKILSSKGSQSGRSSGAAGMLMIAASVLIVTLQSSRATQADDTSIVFVSKVGGVSPFIRHLNFMVSPIANLKSVQFTVQPKPGSVTRPISATYSSGYLSSRGYLDSAGNLKVPVFGLYDGVTNSVTLSYVFHDSSSKQSLFSFVTGAFSDPCGYKQGTVVKARTLSTSLSYDFMLLKNSCSDFSPALMDTDGALRWIGTAGISSTASAFFDNAIYLGTGPQLIRIELDGAVSVVGDYSSIGVTGFHHNIDRGKHGLLLEVDTNTDLESVILEVDRRGGVRNSWNMAKIISLAMRAAGDDPSAFVRRGDDWFHNNAVTYRASDDSLIVSSRENFVIALDYRSSAIKWILGDTSKAWYQYPSLRQYALTVPTGGVAPVGQHAVSITYNDKLLLFDNGFPSFSQTPPGSERTFAVPRKYSLNLNNRTASQIFSYNRQIISQICSSVYEDAPDNYLVDYAVAGGYLSGNAFAEIVALQATGQRVFDYKYPTTFCGEIFNALPIHLEQLSFPTASPAFADTAP